MVALSQLTPTMDNDTINALAARFAKLARSTLKPKPSKKRRAAEAAAPPLPAPAAAVTDTVPAAGAAGAAGGGGSGGVVVVEDGGMVKRMGGVLGLGGLLCGFPYSIQEWGPAVVQQLAERAFDPPPIDATAKKILSEFKRTHADMWEEEHKERFDAEQLASLQDALVTPHSMFA
eukprot:COSAG06_NODE_4798_length_3945_cov_19.107644_2_plen_175_part_00